MRLRPSPRLLVAVSAAALTVLPACSAGGLLAVPKPRDGVAVKDLTADLAFGAEPAVAPPPAAARPSAAAVTGLTAPLPFTPSVAVDTTEPPPRRPIPPPPPALPCPVAGGDAFPEKVAGKVVEGTPAPGVYRWKQAGAITYGTSTAAVPLAPLSTRTVRLVSATPTLVSYEVAIPTP
ncbi:MAG TPA: hypothetical protein VFA94_12860, partial [Acidimicrobiales bacterium]|nr:hypothetical protein [Acidimicrobiales bacterium]